MFKKIISVMLLIFMSFSFAACNNNPGEDDGDKTKEEIVISNYEDSYGLNDERNVYWSFELPQTATRLKMPDIFGDNMMFQRGKPIRIWGIAPAGEKVEIRLYDEATGENIAAKGVYPYDDNSFLCELPAMQASFKTYKLKITMGITERTYSNILVGEVFLASGQSNMQVIVGETYDGVELLKTANNDKIRVYNPAIMPNTDNNSYSYLPQVETPNGTDGWAMGNDASTYGMYTVSAVGYSCALQMYEELNVNGSEIPVGFLNLPVGGTSIVSWLPRYAAELNEDLKFELGGSYLKYEADATMNYGKFTALFNTKIAPVVNFNINGMIWYQGETDEGSLDMYRLAMEELIKCYGKEFRFDDGKMPIVMCHIAPHNSGTYTTAVAKTVPFNLVLDETEEKSPETRAVVALYDSDLRYKMGDCATIHPRVKETIGRRCGMALYSIACTENGVAGYDSPSFDSVTANDGSLIVKFKNCGTGLVVDGEVNGFAIAGEDKVFYAASAEIIGTDTVQLYSEYVSEPLYCSYAYSSLNMKANLKNKEGFAVRPFYSESGKFYCQHDWTDCDYLTAWRYMSREENGDTVYEGKDVDLYSATGATIALESENALRGSCIKFDAIEETSALSVILDYPYDVHQFNNYSSISVYVKGTLSLSKVEVVGNETVTLTLIGTSTENGYTRYNFSLNSVSVGGVENSDYSYISYLKTLRFNFTGTGTAYIDSMSLGNL